MKMTFLFFQGNSSTTIGWITRRLCTDIHGVQRNSDDFGDPLSFCLAPACGSLHCLNNHGWFAMKFATDIRDTVRMNCNNFGDQLMTFPSASALLCV